MKRGYYFAYYYDNLLPEDYDVMEHDIDVDPFLYAAEDGMPRYLEAHAF